MKNIGELVEQIKARSTPPNPDGGIGGLTAGEEAELSDLLNGEHRTCECGICDCSSPLIEPKGRL